MNKIRRMPCNADSRRLKSLSAKIYVPAHSSLLSVRDPAYNLVDGQEDLRKSALKKKSLSLISIKLKRLKNILKKIGSVLVAFSGGVDSTFLLKIASSVLPEEKIMAVTASSATYPKEELLFSRKMAKVLGVRHKVIPTHELENWRFTSNSLQRCYFCKKELFTRLKDIAKINKLNFVVDASNLSDRKDFRPGNKAKEEENIRSPLEEAGLTKKEIRILSKKLGLITWNKPSQACLASRIPYGIEVSPDVLTRINKAEGFLRQLGFREVRIRHYNGLCRIEVSQNDIPALIGKRSLVVEKLKRWGYNYVTVDLAGYRTGSLNELITTCSRVENVRYSRRQPPVE